MSADEEAEAVLEGLGGLQAWLGTFGNVGHAEYWIWDGAVGCFYETDGGSVPELSSGRPKDFVHLEKQGADWKRCAIPAWWNGHRL
jgi:hypothetical protein